MRLERERKWEQWAVRKRQSWTQEHRGLPHQNAPRHNEAIRGECENALPKQRAASSNLVSRTTYR